jgi:hypothetical protein
MRLMKLSLAAGGVVYPTVSTSIKRFEKRLMVDRDLRIKLKAVRNTVKMKV